MSSDITAANLFFVCMFEIAVMRENGGCFYIYWGFFDHISIVEMTQKNHVSGLFFRPICDHSLNLNIAISPAIPSSFWIVII